MKTFLTCALTLLLTASLLVGCGCTNQNIDPTSAPTVLPTNEEIWNSTESTTRNTTAATTETTEAATGYTTQETNDGETGINETTVENHVNAHTEMMDRIRENEKNAEKNNSETKSSRMMPRTR